MRANAGIHQLDTRVGKPRSAGVSDESHSLTGAQASQELWSPGTRVVLMEAEQGGRDAVSRQQTGGPPRIFGGDQIDVPEDV